MTRLNGLAQDIVRTDADFDFHWHDWPTFGELKALWQALPGGAVSTPFQTPEFLHAFREKVAPQACERFSILAIHTAVSRGPEILLPLVWSRKGPFRIVSFPDLGLSDQNGPILSKRFTSSSDGCVKALIPDVIEAIPDCDAIKICKIHATIDGHTNPLFEADGALPQRQSFSLDEGALQNLGKSKKSVYKEARTKFRKLQCDDVMLFEAKSPEERKFICSALLEQRGLFKNEPDRPEAIEKDFRSDFFQAVSGSNSPKSPVVALALRKGEEIVAAVILLVSGASANGVLVSIGDPKWRRLSPGMVLFVKSIEWAVENGIRHFSLGAGLQAYKHRFGGSLQETRKLWVPKSLSGKVYLTALHAKQVAEAMLEKNMANVRNT